MKKDYEKIYREQLDMNGCLSDKIEKLEEENKELQERIDKAIEYLEYQLTQLDFYEDTKARVLCSMLIVILKGGGLDD